ncbi:hypothetical protein [Ralstonia insidiosa]|uniref:hypothetical protein n=1 Tax=Ralstonia insidiosa TaxID=190721 RepID=UPI001427C6FC|nr:hypothetical protein [Ralstonia insidiosa]
MSAVATAVVGGSIVGGLISSSGAQSAADTQAAAQQQASAQQLQMFNTINGQEQPFIQSGYGATTALNQLLGLAPGNFGNLANGYLNQTFDPSSIASSPGYQFAQKQAMQSVLNADTPAVGALSGPAMRDLLNASTGVAEQYYNNYFNQFQSQQQNIFSRLSGLAGLGQNAATNVGTAGTSLGTGAAAATAAAGGSLAAGQIGSANALAGGVSSAGNGLLLSNLMSGGGGFSGSTGSGMTFGGSMSPTYNYLQ